MQRPFTEPPFAAALVALFALIWVGLQTASGVYGDPHFPHVMTPTTAALFVLVFAGIAAMKRGRADLCLASLALLGLSLALILAGQEAGLRRVAGLGVLPLAEGQKMALGTAMGFGVVAVQLAVRLRTGDGPSFALDCVTALGLSMSVSAVAVIALDTPLRGAAVFDGMSLATALAFSAVLGVQYATAAEMPDEADPA